MVTYTLFLRMLNVHIQN